MNGDPLITALDQAAMALLARVQLLPSPSCSNVSTGSDAATPLAETPPEASVERVSLADQSRAFAEVVAWAKTRPTVAPAPEAPKEPPKFHGIRTNFNSKAAGRRRGRPPRDAAPNGDGGTYRPGASPLAARASDPGEPADAD